jgi:hypothetical protein
LTPAQCAEKDGTPQGAGTDCSAVVCPVCDWNSGDPHKMHWAQEPDLSPTGVDVEWDVQDRPHWGGFWWAPPLADDFLCTATGPITDIHIWCSFKDDILPEDGPGSLQFLLAIRPNAPADDETPWSRPDSPSLWSRNFAPGEYTVELVGEGPQGWYSPAGRDPYESDNHQQTYQYNFCIDEEPFIQEEGTIYWLTVSPAGPYWMWPAIDAYIGWKTTKRELRWNDDAVRCPGPHDHFPGPQPLSYPDGHEYEGQTIDLAFVITGEPGPPPEPQACCLPDGTCEDLTPSQCAEKGGVPQGAGTDCNMVDCLPAGECDWNPDDPHKMHWPQEPDLDPTGVDVDMSLTGLADDFKCSASGPIKDIHVWGSFADDLLPAAGPNSLTFRVSIYTDVPAGEVKPWSMPGELLWSRTFLPGQYAVRKMPDGPEGWYDPLTESFMPDNHKNAYQYNFCIEDRPFRQEEGRIYWLQVQDIRPEKPDYTFGWKTTTAERRWNDAAVFGQPDLGWQPLKYPDEHTYQEQALDLAFVITGEEPPPALRIIDGPTVSDITPTSCLISWTTNEDSDSTVSFDDRAGVYDQQEGDPTVVQEHEIGLTDLQPATMYHYIVQSSDHHGTTVASREGFFETAPLPDSELPVISPLNIIRGKGDFAYWQIPADASDNIGVDRVEFYLDGELLGTDYSDPYLCYLIPSYMQMARKEFFAPHTIEAWAIDESGMVTGGSVPFDPSYEVMDADVEIFWPCISPPPREYPGYLYADEGAVPDGTIVEIQARAREYEWRENGPVLEPEVPGVMPPPPPPGMYVPHPVPRVEFYVNDRWQGSCDTPSTIYDDYVYTCEWDASGSGLGDYDIEARAIASDGTEAVTECTVEVRAGSPSLSMYRTVSRNGNYFLVTLTLSNTGTASARVDVITDNVVGFQPLRESTADYSVSTDYSTATKGCQILIDLFSDTDSTIRLRPEESLTVQYSVVPILYTDATVYSIGGEDVVVDYFDASGTARDYSPSLSCSSPGCHIDTEWFSDSLDNAFGQSDYLMMTHPSRLFTNYVDADVQELLSIMAGLAKAKEGTLGYLRFAAFSESDVKGLIEPGGDWSSRLATGWTSTGYLLIVGETEIVPAREINDSGIADATSGWGGGGSVRPVPCVDNWYADISGSDNLPDLIVGRIIGDSAAQLMTPIQTSLLDLFARTDALVISGIGGGQDSFETNADEIVDLLDDEFTVDQMYGSDYATDPQRLAQFTVRAVDKDVIYYRDHGSIGCWSRTVCAMHSPYNFGTSHPLGFGNACLTGNFEDAFDDDYCFAEAFLDSDAGVYIGATERSPRGANNSAGKKFFTKWIGSSDSIGQAFRDTKRELGTSDSYKRLWVFEYNLYGDPKYGAGALAAVASSPFTLAEEALAPPLSSLNVTVPDYQVTQAGPVDYVEIPGGELLLVPDKPAVPFYVASVDYPEGYQVQDVVLTDRSGLVTATDLNLPVVSMDPGADGSEGSQAIAGSTAPGWYPEEDYEWRVLENPDGSTTLTIVMYPFYYNSSTTDVEFYKNYSFEIDYIFSTVEITGLTTDKDVYRQGDDVLVDFRLNNPGEAQDVIVNAVVRAEGSGQLVDGLLLHSLKGLRGPASFSPYWDSNGIQPGHYFIEGTLNDISGDVLDKKTRMFRLGICSGQITNFSATPESAEIGDDVEIKMAFNNAGTVNITGVAVIRISNAVGERIEEFRHDVVDLIPSESVTFSDIWNVSEAGSFTLMGHVLYDGKATDPATVQINRPECFPSEYSTYDDFLEYKARGKDPNCWCGPPYGSGYQCDGDADGLDSGFPFKYRVFIGDLALIVNNWKRKIDDPALDPCADIDHKDSGFPFSYRVFIDDLAKIVANWKKKDADLPGNCPRPE